MKKTLVALILINFLAVMMIPVVASAQTEPVKCVKLGANVKWTGTITGTTGGTPFNCKTATENYCLFIAGKAIGETINAGDCGEAAAITTECKTAAVWTDSGDYFTQAVSCLTNTWGMIALLNGIGVVTNWIFVILMIVVALFIVWGAFDITTAAGSPEKVTSGRGKITYALIGLAVALLAKALPGIIAALLGV